MSSHFLYERDMEHKRSKFRINGIVNVSHNAKFLQHLSSVCSVPKLVTIQIMSNIDR